MNYLSDENSRLLFTNESISEAETMAKDDNLVRLYMWYPRVVGFITMMSAACIINMAWPRRKFVFHRLVLAMAIHQETYGLMYVLGTVFIPREYEEYVGNYGTIGTCTFQGFVLFVCLRSAAMYYASFSIYSYVATLNDFDNDKYKWCEKWIHILVHSYALLNGFYVLAVEGYNPVRGFCKMASYPLNCETSDDVVCTRGPAAFGIIKAIGMWIVPLVLLVIIPTAIMIALYCKVKQREGEDSREGNIPFITSREVAVQSCVYLSAIYWTVVPFFLVTTLEFILKVGEDAVLPYKITGQIIYTLFAFWSMLTYWYFSIDGPDNGKTNDRGTESPTSKKRETRDSQLIFNADSSRRKKTNSRFSELSESPTANTTGAQPGQEPEVERRYSFNIFDGTNAVGAFSEFIHDGDSEDERLEREETDRWNSVQDQI
mmetsp:Transcript_7663/g.18773  ORF Transcript_7663/g.18773 Transcript_7663/m.18773 type:complete len:431 (-) Transcript_7663:418-1710(-)